MDADTHPAVELDLPAQAASESPDGVALALGTAALLAACGGGGGAEPGAPSGAPSEPPPAPAAPPTRRDAARFLTQASFGPTGAAQIDALVAQGFPAWINAQFAKPSFSHSAYLDSQKGRDQLPGETPRVSEEMSYEAVWQHWLQGEDQLRARMVWALLQIFVISNIAPDIRAVAMSSYMDMLGRNAFGNWRTLLQDVTLHPAMGYYLNLLESEKENPDKGTHPNENYAREVLQLFSIGLVRLNADGTLNPDAAGQPVNTYDENVVKGFAKALSGWGHGGLDNTNAKTFHRHGSEVDTLWTSPMQAWAAWHSTSDKTLLDGKLLPAGQSAEADLKDALDCIFNHPNVPPFFSKQLIQRLVSSNPSPAYVTRVAAVFIDNGSGVRGDLKAVLRAVLLDPEARGDAPNSRTAKQREPVIRFANFLRGLGAKSDSGFNRIHYLDSPDDALGQSPLLAPSVFNFYSPAFRPAGPVAAAGLVAPEFQITSETSSAGSLNFFYNLFKSGGYGWEAAHQLKLQTSDLETLAATPAALVDELDLRFFTLQMSASTRQRLVDLVSALPATDARRRVRSALTLVAMSPDFLIQH